MSFELRKIKEVGKVFTGKTPSKAVEDYFGGEIPFVTPTELDKEQFIFSAQQALTEKGAEQIKLLPKNSVMVCCIGSLGKIGIAGCELATNQQINSVIFDNNKVDFKYGYYVLSRLKPLMEKIAPLTTVPIINKSSFEQLEIPIPSLSTQTQIAQILDKSTALIAKRKAQIAELDKLVQSVFAESFLNLQDCTFVKLGQIAEHISSGSTPKGGRDVYKNSGILFIRSQNVLMNEIVYDEISYIDTATHESMKRSQLKNQDILLNITGASIGRAAVFKGNDYSANTNQHVASIRLSDSRFLPEYISYFLSSNYQQSIIQKICNGGTREALNYQQIRDFDIPNASLEKQNKFVSMVNKIHAQKSLLQKSLAELEVLHQALMQKAFNGQLVD